MTDVQFLITGVPRSGTGYMAKLMEAIGHNVGHETIGECGISSWLWAADSPVVPYGVPRNGANATRTIQVVRHPWMVISSLVSTSLPSVQLEEYVSQFIHFPCGPPLIQAIHLVSAWNKFIYNQKPNLIIKVEEANEVLPAWLKGYGYPIRNKWEPPPTNYNSREYSTELPITILQKVPQLEQELLMVHCQQYGYQMPQI